MRWRSGKGRRLAVLAACVGMVIGAAWAPSASAVPVELERLQGFSAPGTPAEYNRVGVLKTGASSAKNVLILNPGTSASASYFQPLAKDIVKQAPGWQVWAVERRENLLEDHSVFNLAKEGRATPQQGFDYYLGWLTDPTVTEHFQLIPDADVAFARGWGMRVEIGDLRRVVRAARRLGGRVVMGGHSLGGTITTAYATWDFRGEPGAEDLSGLVYIDGGSGPTAVSAEQATQSLQNLQSSSPWLSFGGIPAPFAGLFNTGGSTLVLTDPHAPAIAQDWPLLPAFLKPPVRVTNKAQYGYALDPETSPGSLIAAQANLGRLAASGDPRGWRRAGELTPIRRYAKMFSGWGLRSLDGTAWYHPQRLTIDAGAVAAGNANPAQSILDVRAIHGDDLPKRLRIYAFGARLGGQRVLDAASNLAQQSGIPARRLTLVDRQSTYTHNDPNSASPDNDFLENLLPFLAKVSRKG